MSGKHGFFLQKNDFEIIGEIKLKVVFVGDSGVGKTSLAVNLNNTRLSQSDIDYPSTIGVSFSEVSFFCEDDLYKIFLWDTAGQERYRSLIGSYLRKTNVVLLCYDITNRESFDHLPLWLDKIRSQVKDAVVILIGNKIDNEKCREVNTEEGEKFQKENNIQQYIERSARKMDTKTVKEILQMIVSLVPSDIKEKLLKESIMSSDSVTLCNDENNACHKPRRCC